MLQLSGPSIRRTLFPGGEVGVARGVKGGELEEGRKSKGRGSRDGGGEVEERRWSRREMMGEWRGKKLAKIFFSSSMAPNCR